MKGYRRTAGLILSAVFSALILSSCKTHGADWDDTLPSVETTPSSPTVIYETEETTTTEAITFATTEKTSRTAATSATPELATTTGTYPEDTETSGISVISDVPKVPISEYTSSTAARPGVSTASSGSNEYSGSETSSFTGNSNTTTTTVSSGSLPETGENTISQNSGANTVTEVSEVTDLSAPYAIKDKILRPYSYKSLDEKSLYIYDALITAISQRKTSVNFSAVMNISADDYCAVYQQLYNDENALFYIDTKMQYAVNTTTKNVSSANIFYKYSSEEIRRMQAAIDEETDKLIARITPNMTEYDIVKLFYDYLAENVVYDEEAENRRDIYGVFADKRAICGGYAKAFSYLCDKVGIETLTITGDADEVPHMWNMVKLGGEWYHIDPTYAVTESKLGPYVRYDYFCVTDEVISRSRTVYAQDYSYPKATAERCNYYVKKGLMADSWEEAREMLTNQVIASANKKELVAQIRLSNKEAYDTSVYNLFDRTQAKAINVMENALEHTKNKYRCDNISYSHDDSTYVIKLFLEYTN